MGVLLLRLGQVASDVLNSGLVFVLEAEGLALKSNLVNEDAGISLKSSECQHQVLINALNLPDCSRVLKLRDSVFLDSKDDAV